MQMKKLVKLVYGDTICWASMRFLTSAMNFDATTYRKIIHSVRIR